MESDSPYTVEIADQQSRRLQLDRLVPTIEAILADHQVEQAELSLAIVDDPAIHQINREYLQHDYPTDVISFLLQDEPAGLVGQLVVSSDTAAREAAQLGQCVEDELLLYVIHGTLHLMGYDDHEPQDAVRMRQAEAEYLRRWGVEHRGFDALQGLPAEPQPDGEDAH